MHLTFKAVLCICLAVFTVISNSGAAIVRQRAGAQSINRHSRNRNNAGKSKWGLLEALTATSDIRGFNGTWITGDEFYYTAHDRSIHKYNAARKTDSVFVRSDFLNGYGVGSTFTLSPDNKQILVRYDRETVFRHSSIAKYDIYDIETGRSTKIGKGLKLQYCAWSPVKDLLAYVLDNNVYIHYTNGRESHITTDGEIGIIYNGIPDWVYEEEVLSSGSALWWSDDGSKLAVGFFNDTEVKTFKYFLYGDPANPAYQYPQEIDLKYPKPGTPNPAVALRVYDVSNNNAVTFTLKAPIDIVSHDHILQNVAWVKDKLLITWLNRRQNIASIQLCTLKRECREVKRIEEPKGWIEIGNPKCLKSGNNCIFAYWIDDWYQIWNLNLITGENEWQSHGDFTVLQIYGYDELNDKVYYRATQKWGVTYHVFSNDYCLTCDVKDADGAVCASASASFSKDFSYYTMVCDGPNPSYTKIYQTQTNTAVTVWEANAAFRKRLEGKLLPTVKFYNVTLADGSIGLAKMKLPPNFDETKKYPMIVNVYGGPNSVRVNTAFGVGFDAFLTTNRQVIYTSIDGRGTGNKGKKLLFSVNNHLGEFEVEDQIFVTKQLQKQFSYIDADRVGIWGWSYGGYMTAKTIEKDNDRVFQCGISVAAVTSWLYYDTIYTERYMGLPTAADNLKKYGETSVLENLDNFRNHDFLLVHGSGDDNVHYQQTLLLAKALQQNNIKFQQMTYTDENHAINNFVSHLYMTMDDFWINCLNLEVDEETDVKHDFY